MLKSEVNAFDIGLWWHLFENPEHTLISFTKLSVNHKISGVRPDQNLKYEMGMCVYIYIFISKVRHFCAVFQLNIYFCLYMFI